MRQIPLQVNRHSLCALLSVLTLIVQAAAMIAAEPTKPRSDKIKFHDHDGKTVMSLKLKDDGAKLVDGEEKELARYTNSHDKLKIKDADDKPIAFIHVTHDQLKLEAGASGAVIAYLKRQADGDWKLENSKDERTAMIKKHGDGVEVEDEHKKRTFKVKIKSGKTSLHDPGDKTIYSTKEEVSPAALGCLGLESITDIRMRVGLLYALDHLQHK